MFNVGQYNKWRLIVLIMIIVAALLATFSAALYIGVRSIMLEQVQTHAKGVAMLASILIIDELDDYRALVTTMDDTLPQYERMCGRLKELKDKNSALYIYTMIRASDTEAVYILDADDPSSETFCPLGLAEEANNALWAPYEGKEAVSMRTITTDVYGVYLTGYAPIVDEATGEMLGIAGVDMDATREDGLLGGILRVMIITSSLILVALFVVLLRFSDNILLPVYRDSLTGTYNRKYFERFLRGALADALRNESTLAVLMFDLDHFKKVNDEFGHPFGDTVLTQVAHIIGYSLRKSDCLARFGGEEFIAALPGIGRDEATIVAERIRSSVENARIYNSALDDDIGITVSIGIAVSYDCTYERIVSNADQALYYSKANGRNRITLFFHQPSATEETNA